VSCQLHIPAALPPKKQPPLSILAEALVLTATGSKELDFHDFHSLEINVKVTAELLWTLKYIKIA
jgi:hypothetical protein